MKAYVITSGAIFALITIAHIAHIAMETRILREPFFLILTLLAAALSIWAFVVLRQVSN
jgi:membrane associated rhomboid family serine protease